MMRRVSSSLLAVSLLAACGCSSATGTEEDDASATQYLDAESFWTTPAEKAAWAQMITRIESDFDDVCGDTFCGGDYSNLEPLGLTCAVSSKVGDVHECVWTFAGSSELVEPKAGALLISKPTYQCRFTPKGRASKLVALLTAPGQDRAIQRALPGGTTSIYDALGDCFQHPIGATPIAPSYPDKVSYALAPDAPATDVDAWFSAEHAFRQAFTDACGASFCQGAYPNLAALRLVCATSLTTGNIKSCAAIVAGSTTTVSTKKGTVAVDARSYRCSLPMKGTPNDLSTMINAPVATPILDRTLPGSAKTVRAALDSCL